MFADNAPLPTWLIYVRRASLDRKNMEALAAADALSSISGHRHQTHWQTMALEDHRPLLPAETSPQHNTRDEVRLPTPSLGEEVVADYQSTGLSLKAHPLALLRTQYPFSQCTPQNELIRLGQSSFCPYRWTHYLSTTSRHGLGGGVSDARG